jgi:hypothetical protein
MTSRTGIGNAAWRGAVRAAGLWLALLLVPAAASAGEWVGPVSIGEPGWRLGTTVGEVATDARGNALAVVNTWSAFGARVSAISWQDGQDPGVPERLSSTSTASQADVAMDRAGNAVAVWTENGSGTRVMKAAFRPAGGDWRPAQNLGSSVDLLSPVSVAMSADGLAVATWERREGLFRGVVQAAVKPADSASFGAAAKLSGSSSAGSPDVAVDPRGNAVVVWLGNGTVQAAARPAGGSFAPLANLLPPGRSPGRPRVAMDVRGHATAVWEIDGRGVSSIHSAERGPSGNFGAPEEVAAGPDLFIGARPQVIVDREGTALVVWIADEPRDGVPNHVRWAARPSGGSFGPPQALAGAIDVPALAMGPDGTAMMMFSRSLSQLGWSLRSPHGPFEAPLDFAAGRGAALAFDGEGDAVSAWMAGGFAADVRAALYDRRVPPPPPDPNLIENAGFETDLTGWNTSGSAGGIELTRESGGRSGGWAAKLANTDTGAGNCILNDTPNAVMTTAAGRYSARVWVRANGAGQTLRLRLREYDGGTLVGTATSEVALTKTWRPVAVSYRPQAPGTSTLDLNAYVSGAEPGTCFYADDAKLGYDPTPPDPNLFANPGFEIDLSDWNTSGSADGVELTREPGGRSGGWAAKLTNTAAGAGTCMLNDAPNAITTTTGGWYTGALWVRADTPGQTLRVRLREYRDGMLVGSATSDVVLTGEWQHAAVGYAPQAPGDSTLDFNAYVPGAAPGDCFHGDDASIQID